MIATYRPTAIPAGRILVTGAAGFIGSALIWALNLAGCESILACDRLDTSRKFRNLVPLCYEDYIDADDLAALIAAKGIEALGRIDTIFHLGACSTTTEPDTQYLLRTNYEYTKMLAKAALAANIRFVYASSAATYGLREEILSDECALRDLRPVNMYAYSKQMFDIYAERQGFAERIVGVKYFNVFGPNEAHKGDMRSVVVKAFEQIQSGEDVQLFKSDRSDFADGEQCRDFIYVIDAVDATLALGALPSATGMYNIGSGVASTWRELVTCVYAALGKEPRIQFIDMPERLRGCYQYTTQASLAKLRAAGYTRAMTPLATAIADYVPYLKNDARLDPALGLKVSVAC